MASKLKQLQSTACQAQKLVAKHGTGYYKQLLEQNKQYIQEPPTLEKCNLLSKQLFYTRLARLIRLYLYTWRLSFIFYVVFMFCLYVLAVHDSRRVFGFSETSIVLRLQDK